MKAYPHSARAIGKKISAVGTLTSSFNVSRPGSGAYATAYDIWADGHAYCYYYYEVMLWLTSSPP